MDEQNAWIKNYPKEMQPTFSEINAFIDSPLWIKLQDYLRKLCNPSIHIEYSRCSLKAGWNVKFKKKGNNLCIIYPEEQGFVILITVKASYNYAVKQIIEQASEHVQEVYNTTSFFNGSKWLSIQVDSMKALEDVCALLHIKNQHL